MKIVLISDTHDRHLDLTLPEGEMLIHAGDISSTGKRSQIDSFLEWFSSQEYKYKIFIAGNHDFFFERETNDAIASTIPANIIYLNDSGTSINGLNIWGSPVQPEFMNWAFNRDRGEQIKKHWDLIPNNTDILVTHGPPYGVLDMNMRGMPCGCEELRKSVTGLKPKLHVFGHIHEGYGTQIIEETTFINASQLNHKYYLTNEPIVIEIGSLEINKLFCYEGFTGSIEFSEVDNCFYGKILDVDDLVTYEAETKQQLEFEFKIAVNDYLKSDT